MSHSFFLCIPRKLKISCSQYRNSKIEANLYGIHECVQIYIANRQNTQKKEMTQGHEDFVLSATTNSLSHISSILNSLTAVSSQVLVSIDEDGLNFITEYSHICRAEITLEKSLFTTYQYGLKSSTVNDDTDDSDSNDSNDEANQNKFAVDLTPIAESLSLASKNNPGQTRNGYYSQTECTMFYKGSGYPFILIFEDNKMIERCEFSTFINLELEANNLGFELNQNDILMEGIIKSDVFYDALKDLKDINSEQIYIYASTTSNLDQNNSNKSLNRLALISKSEVGNSTIYLPNEKSILEKLIIYDKQLNYNLSCYEFNIFNKFLKSIKLSNKCKFKKDSNILSLNLLSLYGYDLPKNYSGTIIDFKILQKEQEDPIENIIPNVERERLKQIQITADQQSEEETEPYKRQPHNVIEDEQDEEDENGGIDVPIFI